MNSISSVSFCERKPNIKKEEKVINGISEHVRGFRMALNRQIPKEQLETHKINASLTGNKSFLKGLKEGLASLVKKNK